ncbi:MAG: PIN domain-containing protein [Bifidobacteriaceae bacterium]|jgi:toxin-antitoxin system PIN domain toxin|nr:PIN domain-containing protein [Bifidobacteriaceae bacterium]
MKAVDANVLIYAVDQTAPHHRSAKCWLDQALSGSETVLLPWLSLLAFVRLTTHPALSADPLTPGQAIGIVEAWLARPCVRVPSAKPDLTRALRTHLEATGRGGNLVNDAFLAAVAAQHRAEVVTFDNDFGRFPGVKWLRPGQAPA